MRESIEHMAARLGVHIKTKEPPRDARKGVPQGPRVKGDKCRKGHTYGEHRKKVVVGGKEYIARYCRVCATDYERTRRQARRAERLAKENQEGSKPTDVNLPGGMENNGEMAYD